MPDGRTALVVLCDGCGSENVKYTSMLCWHCLDCNGWFDEAHMLPRTQPLPKQRRTRMRAQDDA